MARSCARRWYIFLPLLLVTAWFSHSAYSSAKPVYYSQAVIGLAPPSSRVENVPQGEPVSRNALLDIGGASLVANMAAMKLKESAVVDKVVAGGGLPDYVARMFPVPPNTPPMPMIMIESSSGDPAEVSKTLELVLAQADGTLHDIQAQAQVPTNLMVSSFVVSPPSTPSAGMPSRTRSTVAIFIAGAGLTVLMTVLVDILLIRLRVMVTATTAGACPTQRQSGARFTLERTQTAERRCSRAQFSRRPRRDSPTNEHHPPDDASRVPEGAIEQ